MQINKINPTNFRGKVKILAKENTHRKFLYNELMNISKKYELSATFSNDVVEFPNISNNVIAILNRIGIKIR